MSRSAMTTEPCAWQWHEGGIQTPWDGLRKDIDLWDVEGDCVVYLYEQGCSRRPASIQLSLSIIQEAACDGLLACLTPPAPSTSDQISLYLGAPKHLSRQETLQWHLTTRNFFAWLMCKPLAGAHLGLALSDLLERMNAYRSRQDFDNVGALLCFARDMGYTNMANKPDNAVSILAFAERQRLRDLWTDAFAHCVGMNDELSSTPDFKLLGNINHALITKAALRMDIDLDNKRSALASLLEEDFRTHIGLTLSARQYLDNFRSFLQSHLVQRYGYWPPRQEVFPKEIYTSMAEEFQCLYDLLADHQATDGSARQLSSGGLCVLQSLEVFNKRHGFTNFDTILPLLPEYNPTPAHRKQHNLTLRAFMSNRDSKAVALAKCKAAHVAATNAHDESLLQSPLVQAYLDFEADFVNPLESRVACDDARKVRWLLIYAILQLLQSMLRAPLAVTSRESVTYPLCCDVSALPTWDTPVFEDVPTPASLNVPNRKLASSDSLPVSIHPDCETDYDNYFSTTTAGAEDHDAKSRQALTKLKPLRAMSLSFTRPRRLSRVFSARQVTSIAVPERTSMDDGGSTSDNDSPKSDVPSLGWSHGTSHSNSSNDALSSRLSIGSSVYSEPDSPAKSSESAETEEPAIEIPDFRPPVKSDRRGDVLDKGLAFEDFICPGLY